MSLLEPKQFPGVSQQFAAAAAYVWEVLPPRASSEGDACDATVSSPSALRPFAETLREIKPNEGKPPGLWLNFVGQCEPLDQMGQRTRRELHILLSCLLGAARGVGRVSSFGDVEVYRYTAQGFPLFRVPGGLWYN